ncbi:MAG: PASTA domain-containing protein, partial [Bacteroidetes bacterium]
PPTPLPSSALPTNDAGWDEDLKRVVRELKMPYHYLSKGEWSVLKASPPDSLKLISRTVKENLVPNVVGMGLRDAIFLLENSGLKVRINGQVGKVREQSVRPGTRARGQTVYIRLG